MTYVHVYCSVVWNVFLCIMNNNIGTGCEISDATHFQFVSLVATMPHTHIVLVSLLYRLISHMSGRLWLCFHWEPQFTVSDGIAMVSVSAPLKDHLFTNPPFTWAP